MLPIDVVADFGRTVGFGIYFLIGMGFGAVLELAGFGDSRKLSAQFYFKDMTVLKTMFTGIIVACVLIFLSSALGLLDFAQVAVNPTYLWSGIVGGLIMGVGFIVGGFCPGTSVVAASTLKGDGILFFVGTVIGAGVFGETVAWFYDFWNSSFHDRWILPDWLGWSTGAAVFAVVMLALLMFYAAERAEHYLASGAPRGFRINPKLVAGALSLLALSGATWAIGQPGPEKKWNLVREKHEPALTSRAAYVHPLEFVKTWNDPGIKLVTLDLRPQAEFDRFHLSGAVRVDFNDFKRTETISSLLNLPANGVVITVSNGEIEATRAWQWLKGLGVTNAYILEGGLDGWLRFFADVKEPHGRFDPARPSARILEQFGPNAYTPKLKLKTVRKTGGSCS